jgi:predicted nucleotidyltransferase
MRLTAEQAKIIRSAVREIYGDDSQLWLFGSRVDDERRGGDIDLLVRPDSVSGGYTLMDKIRLLGKLERGLGERKIDVVIETPDDQRPIVKIAHERGIRL